MSPEDAIEKLVTVIGQSTAAVISDYTAWHFASAAIWASMGIALGVFAIRYFPQAPDQENDEWIFERLAVRCLFVLAAALIIGCNFPDLISPRAISIHQLIKDVRG